jgi:crotonobetaine/carnitine-CoA ligase
MTNELWRRPVDASREGRMPPRICIGGGPRLVYREFEERFNVRFSECFGMTETCGGCLFGGPGRSRPGTAGWSSTYADVRVVDGEIRLLPLRPHVFMEGYFRSPDLTAAAYDEHGWYRSGDAGMLDDDGSIRWLGRLGDIIRRKGENMSAVEIEAVLVKSPGILDAAVVGVHFEGDEEVGAHIVRAPGSTITEAEVVDWCHGRVAHFMVPRFVRFTDALPKTITGRTQKFLLREIPTSDFWDRRAAGYRLRRPN